MASQELKQKIKELPLKPGVYIYKDTQGDVIYIGKAKALKKRVSSYFTKTQFGKTRDLVARISDLEFILTDNEIEALILEARLIRQHKPKYNIALKDGVRYAYLKLTDHDFPQLLTVRHKEKDGGKYFGPYTDGTSREYSAKLLRSIFQLRTCAPKMPNRVCLQYYIGNCTAPCIGKISKEDYEKNVRVVHDVLKGNTKFVIRNLEQEMKHFSREKNFEIAKLRRDQIKALQRFGAQQKMEMHKSYDEDILHYIDTGEAIYLQLFKIDKGRVTDKQEFTFEKGPDEFLVEAFIKQYYSTNAIPDVLIVPKGLKEQDLIESYLTKVKGKRVKIEIPYKGSKKKLLDLVYHNVLMATELEDQALINLRDHLNLSGIPEVIECFDISNLRDEYIVASMVQFRGAQPDKSNYRKFKIKTVPGQDDFASMREVVRRRYTRLLKEKLPLPNLIVIDGGKGQLGAAWGVLQELGVQVPVIGLAKKEEEIYLVETEKPLKISQKEAGLKLLINIRNEAHRFAITYHRLLRKKGFTKK